MAVLKYKDGQGNYQSIVGLNVQNEVVQTTGNSTTAVMSQKAVSDLVPAQASSENQLADKNFVNSSINTATATYQGCYNLVSDLSLTTQASHGQIEDALATKMTALSITPDNNDYAFVQIPTADATPTEIASVERYKFNGTRWSYEYALNNSGFTAAQWAAVNSGITSGLVAKLSGMTGTSTTNDIASLFGMNSSGVCKNIGLSDLASLMGVGAKASYTVKSSGANVYAGYFESAFLTLVVDTSNAANYILFATFRPQPASGQLTVAEHTNYVISSNGLSLGNKNNQGTQVVTGAANQTWHVIKF